MSSSDNPSGQNQGPDGRPAVALIAGPTASGKSALALELARRADAVIINADASQVYSDLAILSARPSAEEMAAAPHRLFGAIDGSESCSAARWAADAKQEIAAAHNAGRLPVLVGGTGLYIRTLLDGIAPVPDIDADIRQMVRALPVADAYEALKTEDPESAARLAPADTSRVARALEVVRSTGKPLGWWHQHMTGGIGKDIALHPLVLLPPREWLFERCDRRFEAMLEHGAIAEVERLLDRNLPTGLPVMRAIGVREIAAWLSGEISREAMIALGQTATRQYAKRQYTWFSNQPPRDWPCFREEINSKAATQLVIKLQL
ncbi:tRNA (adenosine(37)-N6)-dimethylallyltransferase MiaA [Rhizorhapis sp.]|uniref:tRNA (adenosine(37)-N6)-dimethylallyltransferase MiaA n=1 Tax=Rhizorhapis sp. TaxID=1968842 RepID=UPI002B46F44C|nr:tRNA (adenosine(37)-N6)-dimethylallyltransferase MiaA [Rhizorhapis sp.]HKR17837.1 tRNA (adenosine(37)-N6)-dimethylallyltransferase MiaA [Rhizorhapis sp.]